MTETKTLSYEIVRTQMADDENLSSWSTEDVVQAFKTIDALTVDLVTLQAKLLHILEKRNSLRLG